MSIIARCSNTGRAGITVAFVSLASAQAGRAQLRSMHALKVFESGYRVRSQVPRLARPGTCVLSR